MLRFMNLDRVPIMEVVHAPLENLDLTNGIPLGPLQSYTLRLIAEAGDVAFSCRSGR